MTRTDPDDYVRRLAGESLVAGDPTAWYEQLYAAAEAGRATVPWDRGAPHWMLMQWARERKVVGTGQSALVVGCGYGDDAEYIGKLGFVTTGFDVSATAVRAARRRFADSRVRYVVADLLAPPLDWREAFDLVVESQTVQALPESHRPVAIANIARMVRPGGTLIVIAFAAVPEPAAGGPPWPLTRGDIEAFTARGLQSVEVRDVGDREQPAIRRWCAEFLRPTSSGAI